MNDAGDIKFAKPAKDWPSQIRGRFSLAGRPIEQVTVIEFEERLEFVEFRLAHAGQMRLRKTANQQIRFPEAAIIRLVEQSLSAGFNQFCHIWRFCLVLGA